MLQQYGCITQLVWHLYALSPPHPRTSFDYVIFPFIEISKPEFATVGKAGRREKIEGF